jgi:hypothetical protein
MKILAALLLLIPGLALATPVTFTVLAPVETVDSVTGAVAPITVPVGTAIDCGPTATAGDFAGGWGYTGSVTQPATTLTVDLPNGTYFCAAHSSLSRTGTLGPYSNVVTFTLPVPVVVVPPVSGEAVPKAPTLSVKIG